MPDSYATKLPWTITKAAFKATYLLSITAITVTVKAIDLIPGIDGKLSTYMPSFAMLGSGSGSSDDKLKDQLGAGKNDINDDSSTENINSVNVNPCQRSISSALKLAFVESRFLVIYSSPTKINVASPFTQSPPDEQSTLLSKHFGESGRYNLFQPTNNSREISKIRSIKGVKANKNGLLLVVAPSSSSSASAKLLAQHHCKPIPKQEALGRWLGSLKKRYRREISTMKRTNAEIGFARERSEGYEGSLKNDMDRERAERLEIERLKKEIELRRRLFEERKLEIPDEPEEGKGVLVRVNNGSSGSSGSGEKASRRFDENRLLSDVINWCVCEFTSVEDVCEEDFYDRGDVELQEVGAKAILNVGYGDEEAARTIGSFGNNRLAFNCRLKRKREEEEEEAETE
ncbi:hypothetical protein ScalyP_jg11602 [Parmales sp. scaly parma]|nr:hypothetical protein ScalyP_jg11602 [Parmales sp. scaly parma]